MNTMNDLAQARRNLAIKKQELKKAEENLIEMRKELAVLQLADEIEMLENEEH